MLLGLAEGGGGCVCVCVLCVCDDDDEGERERESEGETSLILSAMVRLLCRRRALCACMRVDSVSIHQLDAFA
jgi:hypothetical protein